MNTLGSYGEVYVTNYLRKQGYIIRATNVTYRGGEIDIIAQKDDTCVFVEVKTRSKQYFNTSLVITSRKQKTIIGAAHRYLHRNPSNAHIFRFDVALVTRYPSLQLEYIPNAFAPEESWIQ